MLDLTVTLRVSSFCPRYEYQQLYMYKIRSTLLFFVFRGMMNEVKTVVTLRNWGLVRMGQWSPVRYIYQVRYSGRWSDAKCEVGSWGYPGLKRRSEALPTRKVNFEPCFGVGWATTTLMNQNKMSWSMICFYFPTRCSFGFTFFEKQTWGRH